MFHAEVPNDGPYEEWNM